jgi:neutral ceramidase
VIVGLGKSEITPKLTNTAMLGYGNISQIATSIHCPIYARSMYVQSKDSILVLINLEICFITDALRSRILDLLRDTKEFKNISSHELIVTAQHTHSAPGGIDEYSTYNLTTPGYIESNLESYAIGSVQSVLSAHESSNESKVFIAKDYFSPSLPVGFNRSLLAYIENPEIKLNNLPTDKHLAFDRLMKMLIIKNSEGLVGCLNWFGVHGTSLPSDNGAISGDNKGMAASELEQEFNNDFISIFNQGNAGDISPNWIWDENLKRSRGVAQDPFKNAQTNGVLQANKAKEILDTNENYVDVGECLDSIQAFEDMSRVVVDSEFLPRGNAFAKSSSACLGVSFLEGTKEGPGVSQTISFILKLCSTLVKTRDIIYSLMLPSDQKNEIWDFYRSQGNKDIFLNAKKKEILGISNLLLIPIPEVINPVVRVIKSYYKKNALRENTWIQEILPIQLSRIGSVLICSIPGETTSMAGQRIEKQLMSLFSDSGITEIIISPYSNGYCGYITTPEEYEVQLYEGGHTLFGKWTLPAFQTVIKKLAVEFKKEKDKRDLSWSKEVLTFTKEELDKRSLKEA